MPTNPFSQKNPCMSGSPHTGQCRLTHNGKHLLQLSVGCVVASSGSEHMCHCWGTHGGCSKSRTIYDQVCYTVENSEGEWRQSRGGHGESNTGAWRWLRGGQGEMQTDKDPLSKSLLINLRHMVDIVECEPIVARCAVLGRTQVQHF
jgi:hypothetical protein